MRLIPDQERIESFWLLGLHGNVGHHGELRAAPRPVQQLADVIGWSLEGCLDAAAGKVTHPSAHAMLQGHPPAGGAEVDALDLTGDKHPIADHKQTVRHGSRRCGTSPSKARGEADETTVRPRQMGAPAGRPGAAGMRSTAADRHRLTGPARRAERSGYRPRRRCEVPAAAIPPAQPAALPGKVSADC